MVDTKSPQEAATRYQQSISRVPAAYQAGVRRTQNWQERAVAGEDLYVQRVTEAAQQGRRAAGVRGVSDEEWRNRATEKGAQRIGPGMQAAAGRQQEQITKVIEELRAVNLPPRSADLRQNYERTIAIGERLRAAKEAGRFQQR